MQLSLKYWKHHSRRAIALLSAIMISTMSMTIGIFLARSASQTDVENKLDFCGNYDIVVPDIDVDEIGYLSENDDIERWGMILNGGTCKTAGSAAVRYGAMENEDAESLFHYEPEKNGRYPVRKGEIAGYKSTFEALGTAAVIGNKIEMDLYGVSGEYLKTKEFTIVGVLNDQRDTYSDMIRSMEDLYGADAEEMDFPELFVYKDDVFDDYTMTAMILCSPDADQYKVRNSLKSEGIKACDGTRLMELSTIAVVDFETENDLYENAHLAYNDFYSSIIIPVFMCIILVVSFFSIYGVMSGVIIERQKQLGLLRSIGISKKKSCNMLIMESAFFCLTGAAGGYGLGILFYIAYLHFVKLFSDVRIYSAFNAHPIARAVSLNPYVYPWLLAVIFSALAFLTALFRGINRSPLEMLHPERMQPVKREHNRSKDNRIIRNLIGRNLNRDVGVIIVIFITAWTLVFGGVFMLAKSDYDSTFTKEMLDEISGVDADYSASKNIYDTMLANVQFNRHNEGISKDDLKELQESVDTIRVTGITKLPGIKLLYNEENITGDLKKALRDLNISNNIPDFLSELNEKSLKLQGYGKDDLLYNMPATAIDPDFITDLEGYVVSGKIDMGGLQNGTKVIIAEYGGDHTDNPYKVGDKFTLTDTVITDEYIETYDFSHNTMPKNLPPAFTYDYADGSLTDLPGYSFGEKVSFDVEVCAVIHIEDESLSNMLYSESYIMNDSHDGYVSPEYNIVCCREALEEWGLPDKNYTDVYVDLSHDADMDRFEILWYTIIGHSGDVNSISRAALRDRIVKTEISNIVLFASMIIMVVLSGIFGMINSYSFAVKKNIRNFQILRAIGMSQKKINITYVSEMLIWPVIATVTSVIPIQIFDMVKKYAYHYAFDLGNNAYKIAENGKMEICWQALFPWYIELWEQPVFLVMAVGFGLIILVNIFAGLFPMRQLKKIDIVDGIRNEGF